MSRPVGAHLVLGGEDLTTTSLAREVALLVHISIMEFLHVLCSENFTTLSAGEPLTLRDILLLSSRIGRFSLSANYFRVSSRKLYNVGCLFKAHWWRSFVSFGLFLSWMSSIDMFHEVLADCEGFWTEIAVVRIF